MNFYFEGVRRAAGREGGNIIITRLPEGWFWQIPITGTVTSIGFVARSEAMRASGLGPGEWFDRNLAASPALRRRCAEAVAINEYRATADYSHMYRDFAGPRHFLLGDAATFSDPIFSSGVYLGLESARLAAEAILRSDGRGRGLSASAQAGYTRALKRRTRRVRHLIDAFYDDSGFAVFMNPSERFSLFAAVNSVVAGQLEPEWPVRWRYALFRFICRLNRNYRLMPNALGEAR
ncbi:MAG: tryptophan 7-halogenase [Opitutales bacterium]